MSCSQICYGPRLIVRPNLCRFAKQLGSTSIPFQINRRNPSFTLELHLGINSLETSENNKLFYEKWNNIEKLSPAVSVTLNIL